MPAPKDTPQPAPTQGPATGRLRRNALTAVLIVAVMVAAVIALTLHRSSPSRAVASPTTASAGTAATPDAGAAVAVSINDFAFEPSTLTVKAGTTVTWTNLDTEAHTVRTTKSTTVKSDVLATNATFSFTFANPGTYDYHCSIHPEMHGSVVVTA